MYAQSKWDVRHRLHCFVLTDTYLYNFTKRKTYRVNHRWRHTTCLQHPCYDVGCYPDCSGNKKLIISTLLYVFHFFLWNVSTDTSVVCWDQVGLVRLGILCLELGKNYTFWHWEWGRISAPKSGDREP